MKRWSTGDVSGAVGKSYKLHQDVLGYGLLGAGISTNLFDTRGFIYTKAGLVFTLAAQTKLQLQYLAHSGADKGRSQFQESSMQFSWFPSQDQAVGLSIKHIQLPELEAEVVGLDYYSFF